MRYELEPEILSFADFDGAQGKRVLEIGVGMGADFVRWSRAGAFPTGVDLTERAAELTHRRVQAESRDGAVLVGDAERLPFADASFDWVYSWGVLHHTPNTSAAVKEAIRVLRPGGTFKLMMYHRHSWLALAAWVRFGLVKGKPFTSLRKAVSQIESPGTQAFTKQEVRKMLQGLDDILIESTLTHWDRRWGRSLTKLTGHRFGWFLLMQGKRSLS